MLPTSIPKPFISLPYSSSFPWGLFSLFHWSHLPNHCTPSSSLSAPFHSTPVSTFPVTIVHLAFWFLDFFTSNHLLYLTFLSHFHYVDHFQNHNIQHLNFRLWPSLHLILFYRGLDHSSHPFSALHHSKIYQSAVCTHFLHIFTSPSRFHHPGAF